MFTRLSRKTGEFIKISNCVNYTTPPPPEPFCCHETDHCKGCRYPSTGFICWHADGTCMRTDAEKIRERQRKEREARLRSQQEVQIVSVLPQAMLTSEAPDMLDYLILHNTLTTIVVFCNNI